MWRFLCGHKFLAPWSRYQGAWLLDHVVHVWYAFCKKLPVFFKIFKMCFYLPSAQNLAMNLVSLITKVKSPEAGVQDPTPSGLSILALTSSSSAKQEWREGSDYSCYSLNKADSFNRPSNLCTNFFSFCNTLPTNSCVDHSPSSIQFWIKYWLLNETPSNVTLYKISSCFSTHCSLFLERKRSQLVLWPFLYTQDALVIWPSLQSSLQQELKQFIRELVLLQENPAKVSR